MKIKFTEDFFHYGSGPNVYHCPDEEINKHVKQVKKALKRKGVDFAHAGTGDTIVIGVKYDDGFNDIYVAKNYYNFCYPREKEKE